MSLPGTWVFAIGFMNKETIDYYNRTADQYYWNTVGVDLGTMRKLFASYLPAEATIIDLGCGSGRDVMAFNDMGHNAIGLDASEELVNLAKERLHIRAIVGDISSWITNAPFDGIWCCASLIHLNDKEKEQFFKNLNYNLKKDGVIYIAVKDGVETGFDENGRFISNCTLEELKTCLEEAGCRILEIRATEDVLGRDGFKWLNVIARKEA